MSLTVHQFFRIVEIRTKIVSVSTLLIAHLYLLAQGFQLNLTNLILTVSAALLVDMGTTGFNTFFDYEHQVDHREHNREEDKVLVHQQVPPAYALLISAGLFTIAIVLGFILILRTGWPLLILGVLSLSAGYLYSGGPKPISRTPLGELFAGGFLGSILFFVVVLSQNVPISSGVILSSLPSTIFIAGILTVNNTCDIEGDAKAGRKTLSILLGYRLSKVLIYGEITLAYLIVLLVSDIHLPRLLLVTVGWGVSVILIGRAISRGLSHQTKGPSMGAISKSFIVFTLTYAASLALEYLSS